MFCILISKQGRSFYKARGLTIAPQTEVSASYKPVKHITHVYPVKIKRNKTLPALYLHIGYTVSEFWRIRNLLS